MIIRRFNESLGPDIKKWTFDELEEFLIFTRDAEIIIQKITDKLEEFLFYKKELLPTALINYMNDDDYDPDDETFYISDIGYSYRDNLIVHLRWDDGDEEGTAELNKNQIQDFIYFLNDPDIYKNSKKYNL